MKSVEFSLGLPVYTDALLPRDAMHKRGLCRHAVSMYVCTRPHVRGLCQNE